MDTLNINVENIKCGGCASTITKKMTAMAEVSSVDVDIENGIVTLQGDHLMRDTLVARLESLGYPEVGSVAGLKSAKAKAKSVVSCAVGRLDKA